MVSGLLAAAVVVLLAATTAAAAAAATASQAQTSAGPLLPPEPEPQQQEPPGRGGPSLQPIALPHESRQPPAGDQDTDTNDHSEAQEAQAKATRSPDSNPTSHPTQIETTTAQQPVSSFPNDYSVTSGSNNKPIYTNQFVIQVKGGEEEAKKVAAKHGFVYLNHILGDYYHLEHRRLSKRSISAHDEGEDALKISIQQEPQVLHLERQVLKRRVKRDFLELTPSSINSNYQQQQNSNSRHQAATSGSATSAAQLHRPANQQPANRQQLLRPGVGQPPRPLSHHYTRPANQPPAGSRHQSPSPSGGSSSSNTNRPPPNQTGRFGQPPEQHHAHPPEGRTQELLETAASSASLLFQQATAAAGGTPLNHRLGGGGRPTVANSTRNPTGSNSTATGNQSLKAPFNDPSWPHMWYLDGGAKNGFDLNVMAAWKMGYTGKGIVITILDDGLEKDHPDLQANYDPMASFDINGDDADPMPRYDINDSNRHGTRCAGEVAAVPDNNICSIGIAYNSRVGGVRMLDGDVTDAVEARSLSLNNQHIHIYSASWGPDDNGKTVDGPGEMATRAFIEGVTNGRAGLGSIFVFASGNGGREHDNCNCDGYTNSIWTLSISSTTENGYVPWYIEACSSTLATTYSSGSYEERQIATTDLHHSCTTSHTGTSASAPLAAGICALVLESNPSLSWRDMQHIVVRTAKPANLVAKDWRTNGLGRNVSHAFGYGLMDAAAMIHLARRWTTVPVQYTCEVRSPQMEKFIPAKGYIELKLRAECANVRHLEHVQSKVTLTASRRGDLHIYLISPHGTRSTLLAQRPNDQAEQGFRNWPFMTVHSWGESPNGVWTLEVHNDGKPQNRAFLKEWTLILYGTYEDPNRHLDPQQLGGRFTGNRPQLEVSLPPAAATSTSTTTTTTSTTTTSTTTSTTPAPYSTSGSKQPPAPISPETPNSQLTDARFGPHWTFAPPPPPPVSAPGRPPTSGSHLPPATMTTTTTPATGKGSPQRVPPPEVSSGAAGGTGPDFDIVSPAATRPTPPSGGPQATHELTTLAPPGESGITKPSVGQLSEGMAPGSGQQPGMMITSTPVANPTSGGQAATTGSPMNGFTSGQPELDGNQIDLKLLSKDYRSSGGQSIYSQIAATGRGASGAKTQVSTTNGNQLGDDSPQDSSTMNRDQEQNTITRGGNSDLTSSSTSGSTQSASSSSTSGSSSNNLIEPSSSSATSSQIFFIYFHIIILLSTLVNGLMAIRTIGRDVLQFSIVRSTS